MAKIITPENKLRKVIFSPYGRNDPRFGLVTWDTNTRGAYGKSLIGYRLSLWRRNRKALTLFEGEDFGCPPNVAVDSDEAVRGVMHFLTLRPGDTDAEYFENYTKRQRDYCSAHAEDLAYEVARRFGEG